ncbi:hypothetical protein PQX77_002345 [Marasmius sp. AFHP31]|nr:hypothetical protein PQX77_002345 [Marasmius sp. AFHP31]
MLSGVERWLQSFPLKSLIHLCYGIDPYSTDAPYSAFRPLAIPPQYRQDFAEHALLHIIKSSPHTPSHPVLPRDFIASDASTLPPAPSILQPRTSSFAFISSSHTCLATLDTFQRSANNQLAERYGILTSALHAIAPSHTDNLTILSDSLSMVRRINTALTSPIRPTSSSTSVFPWAVDIFQRLSFQSTNVTLSYTSAHTNSLSTSSIANDFADQLQQSSHIHSPTLRVLPRLPYLHFLWIHTFFTRDHTHTSKIISYLTYPPNCHLPPSTIRPFDPHQPSFFLSMTHLLHLNTHIRGRSTHTPLSFDYTPDPPNWTLPLPDPEEWVTTHGAHLAVGNSKPHTISSSNAPNLTNIASKREPNSLPESRHSSDVQNTLCLYPNEIVRS